MSAPTLAGRPPAPDYAPPAPPARPPRRAPSLAHWLVAACGVASVLATSAVLAGRKWMWYDETLTWHLVNDPSYRHMLTSMRIGAEAAPPLYHTLARGWAALFGGSPTSLRLFTAAGLCAGLVITWAALRRAFPWRAVAAGLLTVYAGSTLLFDQFAEVRYYGVLTALVAAGVALTHALMTTATPSRRLLVANGAVQALLVLCHIYGGLYSAGLLAAVVAWDLAHGRVAPRRWLAYPVGWLALLPWLGAYRSQAAAVTRSWMETPTARDLTGMYGFLLEPKVVGPALFAAALLAALGGALGEPRRSAPTPAGMAAGGGTAGGVPAAGRGAMLCVAAGLLLVPVMSFVVSRLVMPIFYPRYFIGSALAAAIVITHAVAAVEEGAAPAAVPARAARTLRGLVTAGWGALLAFLLAAPVLRARAYPRSERPGAALERLRVDGAPAAALPIAVEDAFQYLPVDHYAALPAGALAFVFDSAVALAPGSHHREMLGYALMRVHARTGYTKGRKEEVQAFLCRHERFLVVDSPDAHWYDRRVAADPAFASVEVGRTEQFHFTPAGVVRLVRRVPGATPAVCAGAPS